MSGLATRICFSHGKISTDQICGALFLAMTLGPDLSIELVKSTCFAVYAGQVNDWRRDHEAVARCTR